MWKLQCGSAWRPSTCGVPCGCQSVSLALSLSLSLSLGSQSSLPTSSSSAISFFLGDMKVSPLCIQIWSAFITTSLPFGLCRWGIEARRPAHYTHSAHRAKRSPRWITPASWNASSPPPLGRIYTDVLSSPSTSPPVGGVGGGIEREAAPPGGSCGAARCLCAERRCCRLRSCALGDALSSVALQGGGGGSPLKEQLSHTSIPLLQTITPHTQWSSFSFSFPCFRNDIQTQRIIVSA